MVHVLHIIQALSLGGAARSMIAVSKYSSLYGAYRHSVIALQMADPEAVKLAEEAGMTVVVTPDEATITEHLRVADIVQVQYWNNPETVVFLHRDFPSMRLIQWYHIAGNGSPQIITPELVALPDINIPCNPFSYSDLPIFRDMPAAEKRERAALAYDAADFDRVRSIRPKPHSGFNVGYIGTVDFVKMHRSFIPMSAAVDIPEARFIVCGGGIEEQLKREAALLRAGHKFDFRGYVKDIGSVIEILDVYGYPLCEDTYAAAELNLQEVMYVGIPPVVFPHGGIKRLVEHNTTGLVVHSEREYTEAIEYLYRQPAERQRLGANAAEYARRVFGAENAARVMNGVYERLMQQEKRAHAWGFDAGKPIVEQPISYRDIAGESEHVAAARLFVESLGEHGQDFAVSLDGGGQDIVDLLRADRNIAASSLLVLNTGILPYRDFDPTDSLLHLWSGLVFEQQNRGMEAIAEYVTVVQQGFREWRVYFYLARALEHNGQKEQAGQLYTQLRASIPEFDTIIGRLAEEPEPASDDDVLALFEELILMDGESSDEADAGDDIARRALFEEVMNVRQEPRSQEVGSDSSGIIVSAIVSTYNAERFMEGCLRDLVEQTLFTKGHLEIIVIDSGSQQNEGQIVRKYQERYQNIRYIRTERETIYAAWNRGVQAASGKYLTNTNTDDRHRRDALERMAQELDRHPDVALVYADSFVTKRENDTFDTAQISGVFRWPQFERLMLFKLCFIGPQPMWRKRVHDQYGLFDGAMKSAGDYEFWLRISGTEKLHHIPETLGLYLLAEQGIEWSNTGLMHSESDTARKRYWPAEWGQPPVPEGSFLIQMPEPSRREAVPLVSVIIPTYNRADTLHEALASLEQQTFRDFDVVVVNDAGEDVAAVVEGFSRTLSVRYIRHEENRGLPASRNTGLKATHSTYVAYLDDDDIYYPHHLETLVRAARLSGARVVYSDAIHLQYRNEATGRVLVSRDVPYSFDFSRDRFLYENYTPVLCVMHERACLDEVGLFDESFRHALEDWELWVRLSQQYEFLHLKVVTCEFRTCVDQRRLATLNRQAFYTNAQRIFEKHRALAAHRPDIQRLQQGYLAGLKQIEQQYKQSAPSVLVSIIIPTLNNIEYTRQCIESIRQTTGTVTYEIIVVDNGSTDGTRTYLSSEEKAGRLRVIYNDKNETFSHANNQGAAIAQGEYLLFLNNDTKPLPGWLEALQKTFEADSSIAIQGGKLLYPNNTIQHAGIVYGPVKSGSNLHYHIYLCLQPDAPCVNTAREFQMVTGAMLAIRRSIFDRVGGFDERYVFGHEDLDLCLAVRKLGYKVWYNPRFTAFHFESMTKKSEGIEKFELRLQDPDSIDAKNYHYFHGKWGSFLQVDAARYYVEDGFMPAAQTSTAQKQTPAGKPRILLTMYGWSESGGGTTFPRAVAKRYAELGYETAVFYAAGTHSSQTTPYYVEEQREDGVRLFGVYNRPTTFLDAAHPEREIRDDAVVSLFSRVLDTFRPDIVHYHNFLGLSFGIAREVQRRNLPSVYTPHNYHLIDPMLYMFRSDLSLWQGTELFANSEVVRQYPAKEPDFRQRVETAKQLLTTTIDVTLAVSRRQRELLGNFCGDVSRIAVVHQVHETVDEILATSRRTTVQHRPLRFGFIGGVMPHKGVHVLVQAAQFLDPGDMEVWIYGFIGEAYRSQLEQLDRKKMIRWKGAYDTRELSSIASELDAIVLPSVWEDCAPLVAFEAIAMGLPVLGANIGGIPDFVQDGVNGRLYTYDKPQELAALFREYAGQPEKLGRLAAGCRIDRSFDDYINHVLHIYERLLRRENVLPDSISVYYSASQSDSSQTREERMDTPAMNRIQFSQTLQGGFSNRQATGVLPRPLPQPLYLNLGCGRDVRENFVNIDLFSDDARVVGMDIRHLELPDNCADGIIASDILEHFSHREVDAVLKEWARVLKPGGELVIRCPSLRLQVKAYMAGVWDADVASYMIFGGQTNPGDYHCIGFDEQSMRKHLIQTGLEVTSFEEVDTPQDRGFINLNMTVRARKPVPVAPPLRVPDFTEPRQEAVTAPTAAATIHAPAEGRSSHDPALNIVWEGSQFVTHSLALINREQCANIIRSGVAELTIVPYELDDFSPQGSPKFELLQEHDIRYKKDSLPETKKLPYVWIRHQWPPKFDAPRGARWIVMQPWEFSALRKDFVEAFKKADEVWTPSTYARDAFVNSGLDFNKVQIVPNGIDPALFTPFGSKASLPTSKRFLFVGGTIFRKGIDVLLQAYAKAFSASDDVCLVIKDMGGASFYRGQTARNTIEEFRKRPDAPEIVYMDQSMKEEEVAELYRACDVLVSPYRGEGFSLPTLEAMACGLPVIVTDGGATDDFVDEENGWLIPSEPRSLGNRIDGHELTGEAFVLEPDLEALTGLMSRAYDFPAEAAQKGRVGSLRARTLWTWNRATLKMLSRLDVLYNTHMALDAQETLRDKEDGIIAVCQAEDAYHEGRVDEAIELYNVAIVQRGLPEEYTFLTLHRLASIALLDDEADLAEEFLDKARSLHDGHPDTLYIQSLIHAWRGEEEKELDILEPLLDNWKTARFESRLGITLDTLLCDMGRALYNLDHIEDAKEVYSLALGVNNENPDACYGAALCFAHIGAMDEARTMLEWAIRLRPDFTAAREALEEIGE
jgi:GT2 family glycosyltransferase/glycosyltransferase involved in cell wall biosynthesis/Flp pilus assembly protein TadD